jgi:prophage tail gpP-like protein
MLTFGLSISNLSLFKSVSITRSLEQAAGQFTAEITQDSNLFSSAKVIQPGADVSVTYEGVLILTGYIEQVTVAYDAESHSVSISGASKTVDAIDSSPLHASGQFLNKTPGKIAEELAELVGVTTKIEQDGEVIPNYNIESSESVLSGATRASLRDGLLITDDEQGNLVLTSAGKRGSAGSLTEGVNIKSMDATFDLTRMHSEIQVRGQRKLSDETWARPAVDNVGIAKSSQPARKRPLVIHDHTDTDLNNVKKRAFIEQIRRDGQSRKADVTVPGWFNPNGGIWFPNQLVYVNSPAASLQQEMLVVDVTLAFDAQTGSMASLSLADPRAYASAGAGGGAPASVSKSISGAPGVLPAPNISAGSGAIGDPDLTGIDDQYD